MQVIIDLDPDLAARLRNEPEVRHLSMSDAMVELTKRTLQQLEDARDVDVFAAKCLAHVLTFEPGRRFGVIQAIPPGLEFAGSKYFRAMSKLLAEQGVVRVLTEEEQVMVPIGSGRSQCKAVYERVQEG